MTRKNQQHLNELIHDGKPFDATEFRAEIRERFPFAPETELNLLVDMAQAYAEAKASLTNDGVIGSFNKGQTSGLSPALKAALETQKAIRGLLTEIAKVSDAALIRAKANEDKRFGAFLQGWQELAKVDDQIEAEEAAIRKKH